MNHMVSTDHLGWPKAITIARHSYQTRYSMGFKGQSRQELVLSLGQAGFGQSRPAELTVDRTALTAAQALGSLASLPGMELELPLSHVSS